MPNPAFKRRRRLNRFYLMFAQATPHVLICRDSENGPIMRQASPDPEGLTGRGNIVFQTQLLNKFMRARHSLTIAKHLLSVS